MANRSYLYTRHTGDEREYRDIAEWSSDIPAAHLILVGSGSTPVKSAIWTVDEKIAIDGDADEARATFLSLLDWLEPQVDKGFATASAEARELLNRPDRQGDKFHLELGEIYELEGLDLPDMEAATVANAQLAQNLYAEVKRVLDTDGSTIDSFRHEELRSITNWEEQFGCFFSHVLYFNLNS